MQRFSLSLRVERLLVKGALRGGKEVLFGRLTPCLNVLDQLLKDLQSIGPVLFLDLEARHKLLVAKVLQIVVSSVQCAVVKIDLNDFAVNSFVVYHQSNNHNRFFCYNSLLEHNLHAVLPVVDDDFLS